MLERKKIEKNQRINKYDEKLSCPIIEKIERGTINTRDAERCRGRRVLTPPHE